MNGLLGIFWSGEEHVKKENEIGQEQKIKELEKWIGIYQGELETSQKETDIFRQRIKTFQKEIEYMRNMIYEMQVELRSIHRSVSWRMTAPVRKCASVCRMLREPRLLILKLRSMKYISASKYLIPKKIRKRIVNKYFGTYNVAFQPAHTAQEDEIFRLMERLEQEMKEDEKLLLVFSGVKYVDSEGQRGIRLIHEARKAGVKIIFAYWRWDVQEKLEPSEENLVKIPIDLLIQNRVFIFETYFQFIKHKCLLVEFPHPCVVQAIEIANSFGWKTVYDIIDDWEEFARFGQAQWYDKKAELRIANLVDANVATARVLKEKLAQDIVLDKPFQLISNGVDADRMKRTKKLPSYDFTRGALQIGYFGHLTDAWFDWKLMVRLAKKHTDWTFHIIGYGEPEKLKVPRNIILYGKKRPEELAKYAAFWDLSVIPFLNHALTRAVNPIKVFEYLQLRLPVVASYMPEIEGYPYVKVTKNEKEFERAILSCQKCKMDEQVLQTFICRNTWKQKWIEMAEWIDVLQKSAPFCQLWQKEYE